MEMWSPLGALRPTGRPEKRRPIWMEFVQSFTPSETHTWADRHYSANITWLAVPAAAWRRHPDTPVGRLVVGTFARRYSVRHSPGRTQFPSKRPASRTGGAGCQQDRRRICWPRRSGWRVAAMSSDLLSTVKCIGRCPLWVESGRMLITTSSLASFSGPLLHRARNKPGGIH